MNEIKQLGEFIRGRLQFIEEYCKEHNLDVIEVKDKVFTKALELLDDDEEKKEYFRDRFIRGIVLPTSFVPDWVDRVLLESMSHVLRGSQASLYTHSSAHPSIPFEAGRYNARRQARTIFKVLFRDKKPDEWLKRSFPIIYKKCYGEETFTHSSIEQVSENWYKLRISNKELEKGNPIDCDTIVGYLYGALEILGAEDIRILHLNCATIPGSQTEYCVFDIRWNFPG